MANSQETISNLTEFSVTEISGSIRKLVEDSFGRVRVRGELGRVSRPASGHIYLDLKDERSVLAGVIWKGAVAKMPIRPEEGLEVIATGKITTFAGQSKYQMVIDHLEPAGAGALMALLEERRKKLDAEGLFDPARKQLLPFMPRVIGVVTSPTGAVIRDILHRLGDRFPTHVIVWPVRVQGETSAGEVAAAINGFNALDDNGPVPKPDLLIVARGGGSLEDLWSFNEEEVVRAAANSFIPLISAIGHETDTTLIDHAADRRAPTPTGAAEMAVPVRAELAAQIAQTGARLTNGIARARQRKRDGLTALARALPRPDALLAIPRQRFDALDGRMLRGLEAGVAAKRARLVRAAALLSPSRIAGRIGLERQALNRFHTALPAALARFVGAGRREFVHRERRLSTDMIARALQSHRQVLSKAVAGMDTASAHRLAGWRAAETRNARLLKTLSHESVLERGFALVLSDNGAIVRQSAGLNAGDGLTVQFARHDEIAVTVNGRGGKRTQAKKPKPDQKPPDQGVLL